LNASNTHSLGKHQLQLYDEREKKEKKKKHKNKTKSIKTMAERKK
jgi:hypothetical protein